MNTKVINISQLVLAFDLFLFSSSQTFLNYLIKLTLEDESDLVLYDIRFLETFRNRYLGSGIICPLEDNPNLDIRLLVEELTEVASSLVIICRVLVKYQDKISPDIQWHYKAILSALDRQLHAIINQVVGFSSRHSGD